MNPQKLAEPSVKPLSFGTTPNFVTKLSLQFISGDKILDLGVGEGRDILFLAKEKNNCSFVGVDKSLPVLNSLREKASKQKLNLLLKHSSIESFSYPHKFNAIYSLNTLHFLKREILSKVISTMKENTLSGGINVIKVFTVKDPAYSKKKDEITYFQENELKSFYPDWKIVHYEEYLTPSEKHGEDGNWHRHGIAEIIAVKPKG